MFEKLPEATFGERYKYALDMQNSREQPVAKSQLRPRYQQKDQLRAARILDSAIGLTPSARARTRPREKLKENFRRMELFGSEFGVQLGLGLVRCAPGDRDNQP